MRRMFLVFFMLSFATIYVVTAKSLLNPNATFPKTENDISFSDMLAVKSEGYEPFAELSAYQIIQLEEADVNLQADVDATEAQNTNTTSQPATQPIVYTIPTSFGNSTVQQNNTTTNPPVTSGTGFGYCAMRSPDIPSGQTIPLGNPTTVSVANGFCSNYGWRNMGKKELDPHYGVDIGCGEKYFGSPIFATADGVVVTAMDAQECKSMGNYVKIKHDSGYETMYMHLDKFFVTKGQRVSAGCQIGTLGYSGGAKVQKCPKMDKGISHLHYQITYNAGETSFVAPNGKRITVTHQPPRKAGEGPFTRTTKTSINPSEFVKYIH